MSSNKKNLSIISLFVALLSACNSGFTGGQAGTDNTSSSSPNIAALDTTDKKLVKADFGGASSSTNTVDNWSILSNDDYNDFSSCITISYPGVIGYNENLIDLIKFKLNEGTWVRLKDRNGYEVLGTINEYGNLSKGLKDNLRGGCGCWGFIRSSCAKIFGGESSGEENSQQADRSYEEIVEILQSSLGFNITSFLPVESDLFSYEYKRNTKILTDVRCIEFSRGIPEIFDDDGKLLLGMSEGNAEATYIFITARIDNRVDTNVSYNLTETERAMAKNILMNVVWYLRSEVNFLRRYALFLAPDGKYRDIYTSLPRELNYRNIRRGRNSYLSTSRKHLKAAEELLQFFDPFSIEIDPKYREMNVFGIPVCPGPKENLLE